MTFNIYTLGCKLNFSESSDITRQLKMHGFVQSTNPEAIIINSCAVTSMAVKKTRNLVAHYHKKNPDAQLIVIGCYAALQAAEISQWKGVTAVFGSANKSNVIPYLMGRSIPDTPDFVPAYSSGDRTRSFLKIQDGCDYHCTYCTVAKARGESRSNTIENVLKQLKEISDLGIKEVNLTGVNIGDFGKGTSENMLQLLQAIESQKPVARIRISSIEPNLLTEEMIHLVSKSEVIMPHFHIPLQSGSDKVLAAMKRRYNTAFFKAKIDYIKSLIPDACIAADIIAGFPAEEDELFLETVEFVKSLNISYLHVFTYSKREGTPAADIPQIQDSIKKQRTKQLLDISEEKLAQFYQKSIGETHHVLFESHNDNGFMSGFTDNYLRVKQPYNVAFVNTIQEITLTEENSLRS